MNVQGFLNEKGAGRACHRIPLTSVRFTERWRRLYHGYQDRFRMDVSSRGTPDITSRSYDPYEYNCWQTWSGATKENAIQRVLELSIRRFLSKSVLGVFHIRCRSCELLNKYNLLPNSVTCIKLVSRYVLETENCELETEILVPNSVTCIKLVSRYVLVTENCELETGIQSDNLNLIRFVLIRFSFSILNL